jgi:hypothetical protein
MVDSVRSMREAIASPDDFRRKGVQRVIKGRVKHEVEAEN